MTTELLTYTLRPDGTALWLPHETARALRVRYGDRPTAEQYASGMVQGINERRLAAQKKGK